jgi:acyl carrier protein
VLDENQNLLPYGAIGELHISGRGLAKGYLNKSDLTCARFVESGFELDSPGCLYKTGDLVRYLANDKLAYLGRIDEQVKIRGHRIELGEVEQAFSRSSEVKSALVRLCKDSLGESQLVAYVLPVRDCKELDVQAMRQKIRSDLGTILPEYMMPSFYIFLDSWPLTPNGKIDKKRLPEPGSAELAKDLVAPETAIEKELLEIWSDLLKLESERISVFDNFFELGGHSLSAVRLISKIKTKYKLDIRVASMMKNSTIRLQAELLDNLITQKYIKSLEQNKVVLSEGTL